jgi:hypothetical protein
MYFVKYLLSLIVILITFGSVANAQQPVVQFLGGGSSAMFLELGQAAQSSAATSTPCVWTQSKNSTILAEDDRFAPNVYDEQGNIWVTWSPGSTGTCAAPSGTGINVYSYMSLDSVVGTRCYYEVDSSLTPGCVQIMLIPPGTPGANLLCSPTTSNCASFGPDTPIPQVIISALHTSHFFVAGTDIRPEDAVFAVARLLTPCGAPMWRQPFDLGLRQVYGLGYQTGTIGLGIPIQSAFSSASFNVLNFNIAGSDPITGNPVPSYSVTPLGAKPIIVVVSPAGGTGLGAATDIVGFVLTLFLQGVSGRSTDLIGPTTTNPVTTLIPEPLSGAYNVMEYSVPNSSQFHSSQDTANCSFNQYFSNPMVLQSNNGQYPGFRKRFVGTDEIVSILQSSTSDTLGYFFWSAGNAANFTASNGKYLTVDGVDPLQNFYTNGVLPNATNGNLGNVTFKSVNNGDYPIWSLLRLVSPSPTPAGVTNLVAGLQALNLTQNDFIPMSQLTVWHSHFYLPAIGLNVESNGTTINPATPGDLCSAPAAIPEIGADAGGANVYKQANADFCSDFGNPSGLINKAN